MLPIAHLAIASMLALCLKLDLASLAALFLGAIIPDLDYLRSNKHRSFPTHAPALWLLIAPAAFFQPVGFFLIGILIHFILDSLDWGVQWLWPLSGKLYGGLLESQEGSRVAYLKAYIKKFWLAELGLGVLAAIAFFS